MPAPLSFRKSLLEIMVSSGIWDVYPSWMGDIENKYEFMGQRPPLEKNKPIPRTGFAIGSTVTVSMWIERPYTVTASLPPIFGQS
jgi:hypothetical protein